MSTIVFKPETTERKEIKNGKRAGEHYLRVKIEGGPWASVWGKQDANTILANEGSMFKGELVDDGDWKNLSKVSVSGDESPSNGSGSYSEGTDFKPLKGADKEPEGGWDAKNKREMLERRYAGHCSNLVNIIDKVEAKEVGFSVYEQIRAKARGYANQDLQWIYGGGTEEPF